MSATQAAYRLMLAKDMPEAALVNRIVELAGDMGWKVNHQLPALTNKGRYHTATQGHKGFPDLVLSSPHATLFVECKSHTGSLEPAQREWRDMLLASGADWRLWRPLDWLDGTIEQVIVRVQ